MLKSVRSLLHKPLTTSDGPLGSLVDLYFDDRDWRLRYLVVDPGRPMPRRELLVPAGALVAASGATLAVSLGRAEIERCPELDEDKPVFLQHDMGALEAHGDPHLRSSEVVMGCVVHRPQGVRGRVKDLLVDDVRHNVSCIVVDTGVWLPGRRLELAPSEVERIDWVERTLHLRAQEIPEHLPPGQPDDKPPMPGHEPIQDPPRPDSPAPVPPQEPPPGAIRSSIYGWRTSARRSGPAKGPQRP